MKLSEIYYKSFKSFLTDCFNKIFSKQIVKFPAIAMLSAFYLAAIPPAAHAGIEVKVGTFTVNSGTGTQSISGVGFQPKAYILFYTKNDTADTNSTGRGSILSIGMTDGTNQFCMASGSEDNQGTTDVGRRGFSDAVLATHDAHADQLVEGEAGHVSMDSDGFTINITTEFTAPTNPIVSYIAFGGDDLLVDVDTVDSRPHHKPAREQKQFQAPEPKPRGPHSAPSQPSGPRVEHVSTNHTGPKQSGGPKVDFGDGIF